MDKIPLLSKILEVLAGVLSSIVCDEYVWVPCAEKCLFNLDMTADEVKSSLNQPEYESTRT